MKNEKNGEEIKGKLIAVEGLDGSGKSTQIHLLYKWLFGNGYKVFFTEWNSSDLVKESTKKAKKRQLLTPTTFSLIHATDFTDRYERQILPMLKAGYIVLCDRYIFTSYARDQVRGCDPDWLRNIYQYVILPDIVFYFQLPLEVSLSRILDGRPALKYFEAGMDMNLSPDPYMSFRLFQGRVKEQYELMVEEFHFTVIQAELLILQQQEKMKEIVKSKINLSLYKKGVM
ncbi:dTMP kinase [bacterium]|nr:dTMP kinase [bacterium]